MTNNELGTAVHAAMERQFIDRSPKRDLENGRRRVRDAMRAGAKWSHHVPPIGPNNLTRTWRRAIASILRTEQRPVYALAKRLGDPVEMFPLAVAVMKSEAERFLKLRAAKLPVGPIGVALRDRGGARLAAELKAIDRRAAQ